ncbi:hypothetical protein ACFWAC_22210, partial [Streptomyces sp. NPDC059885]|uniref:hypothetical protein n=1 Tax=Streptomyces sp. NPDC059885 TaxID=3346988 RepID=UPI00365CC26A
PPELDASLPRLTEDSFPGVLANVIAGRIANRSRRMPGRTRPARCETPPHPVSHQHLHTPRGATPRRRSPSAPPLP